jgi:O-antigen ligase
MNLQAPLGARPGRVSAPRARRRRGGGMLTGAMVWLMIVLMIVPGSLEYNVVTPAAADSGGNPTTRALWIVLLVFSLFTVARNAAVTARLLRQVNPFFLVFLVLAAASVLWSTDRAITLVRLIRLSMMVLASVAVVVAAWHPRRFQGVVRPIITLMLIGSLIFGIGWPELAIHDSTSPELVDAWHGLATQKNGFGALASFGFVLWVHAWLAREAKLPLTLVGLAVSGACLYLSRSSTALMATVLTTLFLLTLLRTPAWMKRHMRWLVIALALLILAYSLAILHLLPFSGALLKPISFITGKDLSFTGRAEIWNLMYNYIDQRPLLGSGFGAFWRADPNLDANGYAIKTALNGFYPASAHNGYLDVMVDLGTAGLLCLIGYLVVHLRQSLRLFVADRSQGALFLALFMQQGLSNLSESHWFSVTSLDFVLMTLATWNLGRALLDLRQRRGAAPAPRPPASAAVPRFQPGSAGLINPDMPQPPAAG